MIKTFDVKASLNPAIIEGYLTVLSYHRVINLKTIDATLPFDTSQQPINTLIEKYIII